MNFVLPKINVGVTEIDGYYVFELWSESRDLKRRDRDLPKAIFFIINHIGLVSSHIVNWYTIN